MSTDFFSVLSVSRNANRAQIKERFRELARERHPDLFQGDEKQQAEQDFQEITAAFNVLTDPIRRRQHIRDLDRPQELETQTPEHLLRVYLNRGIRAYRNQNFIEAADNFNRAVHTKPDSAQAWHHLALTSLHNERWLGKAREAIERACGLRPRDASYLKLAGKIYLRSGMTSKAKQYYNRAIQIAGPDPAIRKALALLQEDAADRER